MFILPLLAGLSSAGPVHEATYVPAEPFPVMVPGPLSFGFSKAASEMKGECAPNYGILRAATSEDGHYAATRIIPSQTPFVVDEVRYYLGEGHLSGPDVDCHAGLSHDVVLFKGNDTAPPDANPVELLRVSTTYSSLVSGTAEFVIPVSPHIWLDPGESLWISVEMRASSEFSTCVMTCPDSSEEPPGAYWSNATAPNYPWANLEDFGISKDPVVAMSGRVSAFPTP